MALGKYTRIDGQNSSRNCVTISILVFVSTCFIVAWMSMSSSIGPLGVGMTLQQFMVGMPEKANLNNADLHDEAAKGNDSRLAVQDDSSLNNIPGNENVVLRNKSQSSDVSENHESESIGGKNGENVSISPIVAEKSVMWNEEENKASQEKHRGPPDVIDTNNVQVPTEKDVDSTVQTQVENGDSREKNRGSADAVDTSNVEVPIEKNVYSTVQTQVENGDSKEKNRGSPDAVDTRNVEVSTEKNVYSTVQTQVEIRGSQEKNRGSPDVVDTSNLEVPTRKDDGTVQTQVENRSSQEKSRGSLDVDTSNIEVPTEKDVDNTVQTQVENKGSQEKNSGSPDVVDTSNLEVRTEKDVDSAVQTQVENKGSQEKIRQSPDVVDTSNQEGPTEKYGDSAFQTHDDDNETKQGGKTEKKVERNGRNKEIIPSAWMNAKKIQEEIAKQANPSQKQHKSVVPFGVGSSDGKEMSKQTPSSAAESLQKTSYRWKVCNTTAGPDYIPCLDNIQAIKKLRTTSHYEHRERHCPDEPPVCLVPLPKGYKTSIKWPKSRDMIWFSNVPHTMLAEYKGGQNWVKVYDRYLTFPGGGTQFKYGALHYIDYVEQSVPDIAWGKQSRVVLDVGCGVASFGGYLFERDVLTMSLAPKDEHEAQVQFALERGIPAISAVMGTKRLPFPSIVFDVIHCARCRVPWHVEGGKLLLELNRVLRPGGYFVWSATPVYRKDSVNAAIWKDMSELTQSMCWELVKVERDTVNRKAAAIYKKPVTNNCYAQRQNNDPPICEETDDPSSAWYTPLQSCIHKVPTNASERGSQWPPQWPSRLAKAPYWLKGDDASWDISNDYNRWKHVVSNTYLNGSGIDWSSVRNVMDMRASYGGFAAALKDLKLWVMNVVPVNSTDSDTLPIIYERGLFGIYHDWCESFSTYPRSYDLLHANHLFSELKKRCPLVAVMVEVDRILRPGGWLIIADDTKTVSEVQSIASSLHWKIKFTHSKANEKVFCVEKTMWRPTEVETISSAIG